MKNFKTTACPMDCFDACKVIYEEGYNDPLAVELLKEAGIKMERYEK